MLRLLLGQSETLTETSFRRLLVGRLTDDRDDLIDVINRELQSFNEMEPRFRARQIKTDAACDDLRLMLDKMLEHIFQAEKHRNVLAVLGHKREHGRAERILQLRMPVQLIQYDHRCRVAPQLYDDTNIVVAIRFVAHVGYALDTLILDQLGDPFDQARFIDHIGKRLDDNAITVVSDFLNLRVTAHDDTPAPASVSRTSSRDAHDLSARREVGCRNELHQVIDRRIWVVDQKNRARDHFAQIVRRNVRHHSDSDTRRT